MTNSNTEPNREREQIAFDRLIDWEAESKYGTIFFGPEKSRQFPPLPVGYAESLLESGHVDPDHQHNNAPRSMSLVEWARSVQTGFREYQFEVGMVGYMVSPERADSRVAFEGVVIRSPGPIPEELKREVAKEFNPDMMSVDDFTIFIRWD